MIVDLPELREKLGVFKDRQDAGFRLSKMLEAYNASNAVVLAVPAGGVPVAAVVAEDLNLVLDVAVVSKMTLPWSTETGFGAVAFDGTIRLNERLLAGLGLTEEEIKQGIKFTTSKVQRRLREFRGDRPMPELAEREVILVDDGIASGFTLRVAVEALKNKAVNEIIIAVPTGHNESLNYLVDEVKAVYCANVRSGWSFAVADAYKRWSDVGQTEALEILKRFRPDNI
ncbi:MAG: phosphoribosyltransferase [Planctomycetota bacterium]|jgi:predicted phosphoribosyltransferase